LITSWGDPALGGVYKLVAVCQDGSWVPALKVSESPSKTPNPGYKHVWRLYDKRGNSTADLLSLEDEDPRTTDQFVLRHPTDHTKYRTINRSDLSLIEPLLVNVLEDGKIVYEFPSVEELRKVRILDVERLDAGVRRIMNPHIYHVSLSQRLWDLKQQLIASAINGN